MKNLREKFTKWYIKRGYEFGYDYSNHIYIDTDGTYIHENCCDILPNDISEIKSYFKCPWWVRPLLIFFSPSVYFRDTLGKMIINSLKAGIESVKVYENTYYDPYFGEVCDG
jgi:hypothetical protein